jgi:hypothetical protein
MLTFLTRKLISYLDPKQGSHSLSPRAPGTCQVIQQLIDGERAIAAQTEASLQKALTSIKELENGASSAMVAEE